MIEAIGEKHLTPVQRLHRRFNEASARVRGLTNLIASRHAQGNDVKGLWSLLKDAEAKKIAVAEQLSREHYLK